MVNTLIQLSNINNIDWSDNFSKIQLTNGLVEAPIDFLKKLILLVILVVQRVKLFVYIGVVGVGY